VTKLTFLQLAQKVLHENTAPMSSDEIWEYAEEKNYIADLNSSGKTPSATLGARLYVSIKESENTIFSAIGERPKRFYLKSMAGNLNLKVQDQNPPVIKKPKKTYLEKDLHPFVAYYANLYLKAYCKTINHSKSEKSKFGEWLHPDIVGCYFPIEDWSSSAIELSQALGAANVRLYSFELKRELSFANLREAFFQAVSNSSWAHEGYLCAAEISQDEDFMSELKRLSGSFGIGILKINIKDPDASEIIFPAKLKDSLDWESINKLCINEDIKEFFTRIRVDLTSKEIRKEKYDSVLTSEVLQASIQDK
jgi:hypothetical protein